VFGSIWISFTLMSGWLAFQDATICFVAATVVGCHTYVMKLIVTAFLAPVCADAGRDGQHCTGEHCRHSAQLPLHSIQPFLLGTPLG